MYVRIVNRYYLHNITKYTLHFLIGILISRTSQQTLKDKKWGRWIQSSYGWGLNPKNKNLKDNRITRDQNWKVPKHLFGHNFFLCLHLMHFGDSFIEPSRSRLRQCCWSYFATCLRWCLSWWDAVLVTITALLFCDVMPLLQRVYTACTSRKNHVAH